MEVKDWKRERNNNFRKRKINGRRKKQGKGEVKNI